MADVIVKAAATEADFAEFDRMLRRSMRRRPKDDALQVAMGMTFVAVIQFVERMASAVGRESAIAVLRQMEAQAIASLDFGKKPLPPGKHN